MPDTTRSGRGFRMLRIATLTVVAGVAVRPIARSPFGSVRSSRNTGSLVTIECPLPLWFSAGRRSSRRRWPAGSARGPRCQARARHRHCSRECDRAAAVGCCAPAGASRQSASSRTRTMRMLRMPRAYQNYWPSGGRSGRGHVVSRTRPRLTSSIAIRSALCGIGGASPTIVFVVQADGPRGATASRASPRRPRRGTGSRWAAPSAAARPACRAQRWVQGRRRFQPWSQTSRGRLRAQEAGPRWPQACFPQA